MSGGGETVKDVYEIERLDTFDVKKRISRRPVLIAPLGGCEPFGSLGAVGTQSLCVKKVAGELSGRFGALSCPLIPFGCSTPFISFAGAAGVKPRTFVNMLREILSGYIFQGIRKIFVVNAAAFNAEPAAEALRRLEAKHSQVKCALFNIWDCGADGAKKTVGGVDRDDELILSLAAYLSPGTVEPCDNDGNARGFQSGTVSETQYDSWKKRGRDPQKLAALYPRGTFLAPSVQISASRGELFFERVAANASARLEALLKI